MVGSAQAYTDLVRYEREVEVLFREGPTFFALGCELADPGSWLSRTVGGVPIVVVRQPDHTLRALVNVCRHRGAPVVPSGDAGRRARSFSCPYHGWVYGTDGALSARPLSQGAFDDVAIGCDLLKVAVAEQYGMVLVRAGGRRAIDVDEYLCGAEDDLGSFGLDRYVHIESRTRTWKMNWKLVLDTFTESYHIRTLHEESLLPRFNADCVIFEPFGRNLVSIGLRNDVLEETSKPKEEWSLLPYGTIQYFLVPSAVVVHQLDHVETWRIEPLDVRTTQVTTSIHAPTKPETERQRAYWVKNLDLLLDVTGTEDFPLMEAIQTNLDSGVVADVVYGRNEPPLIHFHRAVDDAVRSPDAEP
jgi:phenylpropionate dioxygenase-like ring-hydroxylating dioxygenase large terminal subunit